MSSGDPTVLSQGDIQSTFRLFRRARRVFLLTRLGLRQWHPENADLKDFRTAMLMALGTILKWLDDYLDAYDAAHA